MDSKFTRNWFNDSVKSTRIIEHNIDHNGMIRIWKWIVHSSMRKNEADTQNLITPKKSETFERRYIVSYPLEILHIALIVKIPLFSNNKVCLVLLTDLRHLKMNTGDLIANNGCRIHYQRKSIAKWNRFLASWIIE